MTQDGFVALADVGTPDEAEVVYVMSKCSVCGNEPVPCDACDARLLSLKRMMDAGRR